MFKEDLLYKNYNILGTIIRICSNSKKWMDSISKHISLPESKFDDCYDIRMDLLEMPESEIERYLPIPHDAEHQGKFVLPLQNPLHYTLYNKGNLRWIDIEEHGRIVIDYSNGTSKSVRFDTNYIDYIHWDALFSSNIPNNLLLNKNFYSVHASCVDVNGKGILFTGNCGKGKSTATCAMMKKGYPILTDDRILIYKNEGYTGITISDVIKLRKPSVENFFPELFEAKALYKDDNLFYFKVSEMSGCNFTAATKISSIITLEKTGEKDSYFEKIPSSRVVGELFPITLSIYEPLNMGVKFNYLMDFLSSVSCYRLYFGTDMDGFAETVEKLSRS